MSPCAMPSAVSLAAALARSWNSCGVGAHATSRTGVGAAGLVAKRGPTRTRRRARCRPVPHACAAAAAMIRPDRRERRHERVVVASCNGVRNPPGPVALEGWDCCRCRHKRPRCLAHLRRLAPDPTRPGPCCHVAGTCMLLLLPLGPSNSHPRRLALPPHPPRPPAPPPQDSACCGCRKQLPMLLSP